MWCCIVPEWWKYLKSSAEILVENKFVKCCSENDIKENRNNLDESLNESFETAKNYYLEKMVSSSRLEFLIE